MPSRPRDHRFIIGAILLVLVVYFADRYVRRRAGEVNPHNPAVSRIATFELQPGEVGLVVRIRDGQQPAASATVWVETETSDDEDTAADQQRTGQTDQAGLVRVPVRKGSRDQVRLFVRDTAGRVGGGTLSADRLLSAPDVVLVAVAPRTGRLVTTDGSPIPDTVLTAEWFSASQPSAEAGGTFIRLPISVQSEYSARTDAEGRFSLPGVPVGFDCWLSFRTAGYGEGGISLPAGSDEECRLAPAGGVRVRVTGDGTAADVRRARCHMSRANPSAFRPGTMHVDGSRTRRHDGTEGFLIPNVVPGEYRVQLEGAPGDPVLPVKSVRVTVEAGRTAEVAVPLRRAGRMTGRVVDGASGEGLKGVRLNATISPFGGDGLDYYGTVVTGADGQFSCYVPPDVPVTFTPNKCPRGYDLPDGVHQALTGEAKPVVAAAGETTTFPVIKLYRQGAISGMVVSDGQPIPEAVIEIRWGDSHLRKPVTLKTDAGGRFRVPNAPPGQPAAIRVRAAGMVNATVVFQPTELAGPVTIPVAAGNAFRVRGCVTDGRGRPVERAKVVFLAAIRQGPNEPLPPEGPGGEPDQTARSPARAFTPLSFQPAEVEAVFTDAAGRFESGPLWPDCNYTLTVSADGLAPRQLRQIEGRSGQGHEVRPVVLKGTSASLTGTVVGVDGGPLAGAVVINSGDAPQRLTATTDAGGRFSLTGLYDGPVVVVARMPGYRWGYAVARPGDPGPTITLRPSSGPPAPLPARTDEHRRAEADLVRQLTAMVEKERAAQPKPVAAPDPWAEARKDLDGYLAQQAKQPGFSATPTLLGLAHALAKEDKAKALRALREAAAAAKRLTLPTDPTMAAFQVMAGDYSAILRVQQLIQVAETAAVLGLRAEAVGWLAEAEALALRLPELQRPQLITDLAAAWVTLDPARTEKLLAGAGLESYQWDAAVSGIVRRLLQADPEKALPWLDRFQRSDDSLGPFYRSQVAVRIADKDLPKALRLAERIPGQVYRGVTLAWLATAVPGADRKLAHDLIERAADALVADPIKEGYQHEQRMGAAVFLLWQAEAVSYPDLPSLIAMTLSTRPPVPAHEHAAESWRFQTLRLAVGIASLDPSAGRALLGPNPHSDLADAEDGEASSHLWLTALALADPAAAARCLNGDRDWYEAMGVLAVLERRSRVLGHFGFLHQLGWVQDDHDWVEDEE
jgi:hypothetical protein